MSLSITQQDAIMNTETNKTALVLGATGGIGGEMARKLLARGWNVNALHRNCAGNREGGDGNGIQWLKGDAGNAADVIAAAKGVSLIVHAVNPPGYRNWGTLVLPMIDATIQAARASGARILLPGTVYNFGPDAFADLREGSPQNPQTIKGGIRVEMERRLEAASAQGVKVLIVRAGDFFGPRSGNNWFSQGLIKPNRLVTAISYPGAPGIGHQWAYLPDVAETMMQLIEKADRLSPFTRVHMKGHWDADGTRMIEAIRTATGKPQMKARKFPWWLLTLASPLVALFREMKEMAYLWKTPVYMNNAHLQSILGAEPHTPWEIAVRETLTGQGCLGGEPMSEYRAAETAR